MGKVVEIDCEKPMMLETSPKVTKSKRSLHCCRSISKRISVQVLLQYQSKSYYIIGQEVYYSIGPFITLSGVFYYIIGQLLQYRAFITLSVGTGLRRSLTKMYCKRKVWICLAGPRLKHNCFMFTIKRLCIVLRH